MSQFFLLSLSLKKKNACQKSAILYLFSVLLSKALTEAILSFFQIVSYVRQLFIEMK